MVVDLPDVGCWFLFIGKETIYFTVGGQSRSPTWYGPAGLASWGPRSRFSALLGVLSYEVSGNVGMPRGGSFQNESYDDRAARWGRCNDCPRMHLPGISSATWQEAETACVSPVAAAPKR